MSRQSMDFWLDMARPAPESVTIGGTPVRRGSRVRLRPKAGGDVMDIALRGRVAVVEAVEEDDQGDAHLAVTLEDDPGRDLGMQRLPGHRFFFRADEVEPISPPVRVLVAGIGNVFLGDDGFGVAVARRLAGRTLPVGVTVGDFGIRGMDLAYALKDYDVAVFIDAVPRGGAPGSLYIIDAAVDADGPVGIDTHGMDPVKVLAFARALGPLPGRVLVVGCEPAVVPDPTSDEIVGELSAPVAAAIEPAMSKVEELVEEILARASADGSA